MISFMLALSYIREKKCNQTDLYFNSLWISHISCISDFDGLATTIECPRLVPGDLEGILRLCLHV